MTPALVVVALAGGAIAFANGQNDVSKGVATLVGSGVTDYRRAILWGALWTGAGGLLSAVLAGAMVTSFGTGLLGPAVQPNLAAALAVLIGAAGWVVLASRTGLPVSTTHAIVGAVLGVGMVAYGAGAIAWPAVARKLVLPLLLTPFLALGVTMVLLRVLARRAPPRDCLCAEVEAVAAPALATPGGLLRAALPAPAAGLRLTLARSGACVAERPRALRLTLGHLHWLSSGATSFARGLNDAPKMVALSAAGAALAGASGPHPAWFALVTVAMVAGSLLGGRRVTRVLAEQVTRMDAREGLIANLVTAVLVGRGASLGLPMSTTHVSSGAIVAIGAQGAGRLDGRTLRGMLLAWLVTVPLAGAIGVAAYGVLSTLGVS